MLKHILIFGIAISMLSSCQMKNKEKDKACATNTTAATGVQTTTNKDAGNATGNNITAANATLQATSPKAMTGSMQTKKPANKPGVAHAKSGMPGYFPEGSERLLTQKDIQFLTSWGLAVMKNEIYARHGMIFASGPMKDHFERQSWYHPRSTRVRRQLTGTERANLDFIENYKLKPQTETASLNG